MKNIFLKQGVFREGETEKSYGREFNLKSWFKQALSYFNVPHVDDCCTPETTVPMRYDMNSATIQAYNSTTKEWFNIPASSIGRAVFKGTFAIVGGTFGGLNVIENTLTSGANASIGNPTITVNGATIELFFPNNASNSPFNMVNTLINFNQISGPDIIDKISTYVIDLDGTMLLVCTDSSGNSVDLANNNVEIHIQISIPIL